MSNVIYNAQACAVGVENLGQNTCLAQKMLPLSGYFSLGGGKTYSLAELADEDFVQAELAAQRLFKLPKFSVAVNMEQSEIQTNTNNFGNINVISTKAALNVTFGIDGGTCLFRKLKQWSGREVSIFFVDTTSFAGQLVAGASLKAITAKMSVRNGIKFKSQENEELIEAIELNIQSADANIDEFVKVSYNPADKVGITDSVITVVSTAENEIVVDVKTACDGLGIDGLLAADFLVKDSNGDAVGVTATDNDGGNYTLSGILPNGTYSVELDGTIEIAGFLYATFGTPVSAVIAES